MKRIPLPIHSRLRDGQPGARSSAIADYLRRAGADQAPSQETPEFSEGVDLPPDHLNRRELMQLLGASLALGGLTGCTEEPTSLMMPYVRAPSEVVPGTSNYYATAMDLDGFGMGLLAQSRDGRPIKIEGNPDHPASLGATGVFQQASILELYNPDRARAVLHRGAPSSFNAFVANLPDPARAPRLWLLMRPQSAPHLLKLVDQVRARYPAAQVVYHSPFARHPIYRATQRLFGRPLEPLYDFRSSQVIASFGADFVDQGPMHVRHARDLADSRRVRAGKPDMSRLYVVETTPSGTGSLADHRLPLSPHQTVAFAFAALAELEGPELLGQAAPEILARHGLTSHLPWLRAMVRDLTSHQGRSVVVAGDQSSELLHVLVHLINQRLGNLNATVSFIEPVLADPLGTTTLETLVRAIDARAVDGLVILGDNPAYTAPRDLAFEQHLARVPYSVHWSLFWNETSAQCQWFLPAAHYLESWGDTRAFDGTVSLIQPLLRPLYQGRTEAQVLATFAGAPRTDARTLLLNHWLPQLGQGPQAEVSFAESLQRGLIQGTANAPQEVSGADPLIARQLLAGFGPLVMPSPETLEAVFSESVVYDGRFANNPWLLELPQPITKLTWDNAVLLSPTTAQALGLSDEHVVILESEGRTVTGPVLVVEGHADGAATLPVGFGRLGSESLARGIGFNAYALRTGKYLQTAQVTLSPARRRYPLARTQLYFEQGDRNLALYGTLAGFVKTPDSITDGHKGPLPSLLPAIIPPEGPLKSEGPTGSQWGMAIDTTVCSGCKACVVACQAENNVPVVGKQGVMQGRHMHWLRIDQYQVGSGPQLRRIHQPMLCQHCEKAPCEYVCPVYATVHSPDGLNEMVYNRCIGTRFCSNNCPYKVRRFNWFNYTREPGPHWLQRNPEVTVRARGVMEKCTYCVQRIRRTQIEARLANRDPDRVEPMTACQQACPTRAIVFGNIANQASEVSRLQRQPHIYSSLHHLGTRPRTQYLAKIFNLNPELS